MTRILHDGNPKRIKNKKSAFWAGSLLGAWLQLNAVRGQTPPNTCKQYII